MTLRTSIRTVKKCMVPWIGNKNKLQHNIYMLVEISIHEIKTMKYQVLSLINYIFKGSQRTTSWPLLRPPDQIHVKWPHVPQSAGRAPDREAIRFIYPRHQPSQDPGQENGWWTGEINTNIKKSNISCQGVSFRSCKLLTKAYYNLLRDPVAPSNTQPQPQVAIRLNIKDDPKLNWQTLLQTEGQQVQLFPGQGTPLK